MKFLLVCVVIVLCAQDAFSFFGTLQSKSLIRVVKLAKETGRDTSDKLAETIGNIGKINVTEFVNATAGLSDLIYTLSTIDEYHTKFESSLNSQVVSGVSIVKNIDILLTHIKVYVIPSLLKINGTGAAIGGVFGKDVERVINRIYDSMNATFNSTIETYTKCKERFSNATAKGEQIDSSNVLQYTSLKEIMQLSKNTEDFEKDMKLLTKIIDNIAEASSTINYITNAIELSVQDSREKFRKALRDFDFAVTNANKVQEIETDKEIAGLIEKAAEMNDVIAKKYFENLQVTAARQSFNRDISNISIHFIQSSDYFLAALNDLETYIKTNATSASVNSTALIADVTSYYAILVGKKGKIGIKCLQPGSQGQEIVIKFVSDVIGNATKCLEKQTELVEQTNSKLLFKKEDILLNFFGAADKICGCFNVDDIFGDSDSAEKSVKCIEEAATDIHITTLDDIAYLSTYVNAAGGSLIEKLQLSPKEFVSCAQNAVAGFQAAFNDVKLETKSCLAN